MKRKHLVHHRKITFVTAAQTCYLTAFFYFRNNLVSFASACAFGFLFSFIPVAIMICIVLIRILHASPAMLAALMNNEEIFSGIFSMQALVTSISSIGKIGSFEIIIGISIFWMARGFFASIMDGMYRIFHRAAPLRPVLSQIIIFGGEVLLVVLLSSVIFMIVSVQTVFSMHDLRQISTALPVPFNILSRKMFKRLPYILGMFFIAITYRTASGTKPSPLLCLCAAAGCIVTFWITVRIMSIFLDFDKYNLIYGVLSHLIVLMLEVFVFFILFLLFAEAIYVVQYLDLLLLGELYLLPEKEAKDLFSIFRRKLFIRPDYLMRKDMNLIRCTQGQTIFSASDTSTDVYYVAQGRVRIQSGNSVTYFGRGGFFGELACILNKERGADAVADCNSELVRIDGDKFRLLIEQDSRVAAKSLSQISDYFRQVYGRTGSFLL